MKRLYYLADNLSTTERVIQHLLRLNAFPWQYHVICRDREGLYQHQIKGGSFWHTTDAVRQAEQGALIGIIVGVIGAGFYAAFNPQLLPFPLSSWAAYLLTPMLLMAWCGAVWGSFHQSYKIKKFGDDLRYGHYLIMIDVSKESAQDLHYYLQSRLPQLRSAGEDSPIPIPFAQN